LRPGDIKTFKISTARVKGDKLPTRLKVFGWGENETVDENYRAGDKTSAQLSANQKNSASSGSRSISTIDVPGSDTYKELMAAGQPPLIFGYGRVNTFRRWHLSGGHHLDAAGRAARAQLERYFPRRSRTITVK